jgi:hypothetical protein
VGLQTGRVWQAEEVREGDRWRRYYGFVGRHIMARVADDEIELIAPNRGGWSWLCVDLDAQIKVEPVAATGPAPLEFSFRNHHGVETTAPTDLVRNVDGATTIREGINFKLIRESDKLDPFAERAADPRAKPFTPEEIAARPLARHPRGASTQTLAPAASVRAFQLDLRRLFPIEQPGRYRLLITFDDLKSVNDSPAVAGTWFSVAPRASEANPGRGTRDEK